MTDVDKLVAVVTEFTEFRVIDQPVIALRIECGIPLETVCQGETNIHES